MNLYTKVLYNRQCTRAKQKLREFKKTNARNRESFEYNLYNMHEINFYHVIYARFQMTHLTEYNSPLSVRIYIS